METLVEEFKPSFSLIKYGTILTFDCNQDFAKRLNNILGDYISNYEADSSVVTFSDYIQALLDTAATSLREGEEFFCVKFEGFYTMILSKEFAIKLNTALSEFLNSNLVSPALFSFCKQLNGQLFAKKSHAGFADD